MRYLYLMAESAGEVGGGGGAVVADAGVTTSNGTPTSEGTQTQATTLGLLDWRGSLPENLRTDPTIQKYRTLEDAAKGMVEQQKMMGRALFVPEKEDDAAGWGRVHDKLGRPADANAYTLPAVELPEGMGFDAEFMRGLRELAHGSGLNQKQFDQVVGFSAQTLRQGHNMQAAERARAHELGQRDLGKEFGASAPRLVEMARGFFEHFGRGAFGGENGVKAWEAIQGAGLDSNPHLVAAFADAFEKLGEGDFFDSDYYQAGVSTSETLDKRMTELTAKQFNPGGVTPQEQAEMGRIASQLVRLRDRQQPSGVLATARR